MFKNLFKKKNRQKLPTKNENKVSIDKDYYPIVNDSQFGEVQHVSSFHCIKNGVHIYEF